MKLAELVVSDIWKGGLAAPFFLLGLGDSVCCRCQRVDLLLPRLFDDGVFFVVVGAFETGDFHVDCVGDEFLRQFNP